MTAVHRDGRVLNVSSNPRAPVAAAVPPSTLFELQRHYSPDRIRNPGKRSAPGGEIAAMAWDQAQGELSAAVQQARSGGKKVAWIGPYLNGQIAKLIGEVTGGNAVFWEPLGRDAEAVAAAAMLGEGAPLPRYDLTTAKHVISFGAPFLSDGWGHAGHAAQVAAARDANRGGAVAHFVAITPHRDQSSANADEWHTCRPGTEAQVALALAKLVAATRAYDGPGQELLASADPDAAAQASGVPVATLQALAALFSGQEPGVVVLPGGIAGASANAAELAAAVTLLNVMVGDSRLWSADGYRGPISTAADVDALVADLEAGNVGVLMIDDVDPVHTLPGGEKFRAAVAKAGLVVATTSHPNETAALATLVLPTHSPFEDWGDEEPWAGFSIVRQPAMQPMYDTRSLGDILLDLQRGAPAAAPEGGEAPAPAAVAATWRDHLQQAWLANLAPSAAPDVEGSVDPAPSPGRWEDVLMAGYFAGEVAPRDLSTMTGAVSLGGGEAASGSGDYFLQVYAHPFKLDGRYANEPWAQEVADPMTGQVWDSFALVHPATAEKLGVSDKDLVDVTTATGKLTVGVEVHPCVAPDVIAVALGDGRTAASGRYADGTGVNVSPALASARGAGGTLVLQGNRCSVSKAAGQADLVSTFGSDSDHHRGFVAVVPAAEWHGDEESEEPGHLTGLHEAPMDPRLVEAEEEWQKAQAGFAASGARKPVQPEHREFTSMYPVPDHPVYRFAMTVDTNRCNGCGACAVACYAENNLPVVGKWKVKAGRQMAWIRIDRFFAEHSGNEAPSVHFVPMMCQHCGHAPCESVCPVLATYHTIDGLNAMVYNRCVGTRYCANACPYSVRRFNYHSYVWPEPFNLQLNPDVSARTMGVMEKCTFCIQRIRRVKSAYRDQGFTRTIPDEALRQLPACADACPSQALTFGNLIDEKSVPHTSRKNGRTYTILSEVNTYPAVNYLARASYHVHRPEHASSGHGGEHGGGESHDAERG
ncbi:MAG: 4Fe-4S dicluster domain-containing protein [Myxococcota bacterium]